MSSTYPPSPLVLLLCVLLLAAQSTSQPQPTSGDQATLLAIKKDWGNPPQLASWDPALHADHCSNWTGVVCQGAGAAGAVTGISLPRLNITGGVPASVCDLKNLTRLDLSYNNLTGGFPGALYACSQLRFLDLSNNLFDGVLPDDIGGLSRAMEHLNLSTNHFSGAVPPAVAALPALRSLLLDTNQFTGAYPADEISRLAGLEQLTLAENPFAPAPVPPEFSKLTNLSYLWMAGMNMTGEIPEAYSSLTKLTLISMTKNKLTGEIPAWVWKHEKLEYLYLFTNELTGELPRKITAVNLIELDVSTNQLTGEIPEDIGNLKNLSLLFMYTNQLTGTIPASIAMLPKLRDIRIFGNKLSGELPLSLQSAAYESSFLGNRGLCARKHSGTNLPICGKVRDELSMGLIILFSMLAGIILVGCVGIACLLFRRRKERQDVTDWKMTQFTHLGFTESDVLNNIREENVIGSGGSGKVYRIHLPSRGGGGDEEQGGDRMVAVKKIWNTRKMDAKLDKEFVSEVKVLGNIRHNNIVKLLCCISSTDVKLLVYEYMENGSLDRWLHHREREGAPAPLDWPTRLAIAIDSAKGLSYMHHDCAQSIVHRDVKSSNILLDPEFHAKIADFGLARMLVKSGEPESVSAIGGTFGYMAPEYGYSPRVNEKVDVYSFGVVLLELTTGKVANDDGADFCLAEWAWRRYKQGPPFNDVVDEHICDPAYLPDVLAVFTLGVICTGENPPSRPSMKEVMHHLIRCDRMSEEAQACQLDYCDGDAPLLEVKKGSRRRDVSDSGRWDDDGEDSGNFVVHAV